MDRHTALAKWITSPAILKNVAFYCRSRPTQVLFGLFADMFTVVGIDRNLYIQSSFDQNVVNLAPKSDRFDKKGTWYNLIKRLRCFLQTILCGNYLINEWRSTRHNYISYPHNTAGDNSRGETIFLCCGYSKQSIDVRSLFYTFCLWFISLLARFSGSPMFSRRYFVQL